MQQVVEIALPRMRSGGRFKGNSIRTGLLLLSGLVVLVVALFRLGFQLCMVTGPSMLPTLSTRDLLLVNKFAYRGGEPKRGDLIVCRHRDELLVKRIVGLPGEQLEMKSGILFVNGCPLAEAYISDKGTLNIRRGDLPAGKYAALGDNRALPPNQMVVVIIARDQIVGKVIHTLRYPKLRAAGTGLLHVARF